MSPASFNNVESAVCNPPHVPVLNAVVIDYNGADLNGVECYRNCLIAGYPKYNRLWKNWAVDERSSLIVFRGIRVASRLLDPDLPARLVQKPDLQDMPRVHHYVCVSFLLV